MASALARAPTVPAPPAPPAGTDAGEVGEASAPKSAETRSAKTGTGFLDGTSSSPAATSAGVSSGPAPDTAGWAPTFDYVEEALAPMPPAQAPVASEATQPGSEGSPSGSADPGDASTEPIPPDASGAPAGGWEKSSAPVGDGPQAPTAPGPSGVRRALARLRTGRSTRPASSRGGASKLAAGMGPVEGSSTKAPAVAPATIHRSPAEPSLSPALARATPATAAPAPAAPDLAVPDRAALDLGDHILVTPSAPIVLGALEASAPAAFVPAAGVARAPSRPPVRLRAKPEDSRLLHESPFRAAAAQASSAWLTRAASPTTTFRDGAPDVRSVGAHSQPGAPTSGARLAEATGAALRRDVPGLETIEFPIASAGGSASGHGGFESVLARAAAGPGSAAALGAAPAPEAAAQPGGAPEGEGGVASHGGASASHAGASPEADDLYEHLIERLRRDLLTERERMGDLLGDLP